MQATEQFGAAFRAQQAQGAQPPWLAELRRASFSRFAAAGLPSTRQEDWKYTSLAPLADVAFSPAPGGVAPLVDAARIAPFALPECHRLVFLDGVFCAEHSALAGLPAGVTLRALSAAAGAEPALPGELGRYAAGERPLVALNTALHADGALLRVPAGVTLARPVQLLWLATGAADVAAYPRALVLAERGSSAAVIETYAALGEARYLTNAVTELAVAEGASVEHYRVQLESRAAFHLGSVAVRQQRDSAVRQHTLSLGGRLARTDIDAVLAGEGCDCALFGLYAASGEQHLDHHTTLDHAQPRGTSREVYKGIVGGKATGVFSGKILVRPGAQRTDALQRNAALLLSPDATVNSKPQLEIFADDVVCSHGATSGSLDEEALHYLRSRGLDAAEARRALIGAFAASLIEELRFAPLRERVEQWVSARLAAA